MKQNVKIARELVKLAKELVEKENIKKASKYNTDVFHKFVLLMKNMDFDVFCEMYEYIFGKQSDKGYAKEKFDKMNRDFANWFLSLDNSTMNKAIEFVLDVRKGNVHN